LAVESKLVSEVAPSGATFPVVSSATDAPLSIELYRERGGRVIAEQPVTSRDLADPLAELWFQCELRRGPRKLALRDMSARVRTVFRQDAKIGRYCAGFDLSYRREGETQEVSRFFDRTCLAAVAEQRANALLANGQLAMGDLYFYGIVEGAPDACVTGPEGRGLPTFAEAPLEALLALAEAVDIEPDDGDHPVFFTRSAHAAAERISRRGGEAQPPVETGGLLTGTGYVCSDSGEIFTVVEDVLEATHSEATTYSLAYSGQTWQRIQKVLRARRSRPETRHHRVLGQTHGHNFQIAPEIPPCAACDQLPFCTRTSATLSPEDRTWARAVFACEPWQLSQVWGLDAKGRTVEAFYGQRGGSLERRGYYLIDDIDAPIPKNEE
jgi:hypothetical protein